MFCVDEVVLELSPKEWDLDTKLAGCVKKKALYIKAKAGRFRVLCGLTSLRPYEWVQGLGWEVSGKSELGESLEVIRDSDFQS